MKIQLSFLKGITIICLPFFLSFFNCSSDVDVKTIEMQVDAQTVEMEPLTNVLTLMQTFGGENDPNTGEYLLASPGDIAVTKNGDIIVTDENKLKIYDPSGKGKALLGGQGEGPGEFPRSSGLVTTSPGIILPNPITVNVSPQGFITALALPPLGDATYYNVYTSGYRTHNRYRVLSNPQISAYLENTGYTSRRIIIQKVVFLNENLTLFHLYKSDSLEEVFGFDDGKEFHVIKRYPKPGVFSSGRERFGVGTDAQLHFVLLPTGTIVYCHTYYDSRLDVADDTVTFHIVNLDPFSEKTVQLTNQPVLLAEEEIRTVSGFKENRRRMMGRNIQLDKETERQMEEFFAMRYKPAFKTLLCDGDVLFVNTFQKNDPAKRDEYYTKVYNVETWEMVSGFYAPAWFSGHKAKRYHIERVVVSDGNAYRLHYDYEQFAFIEKYRIDPAVYGK